MGPNFAHFDLDFGPGFWVLVYSILGLWVTALVLFPVNLFLSFFKNSSSFKIVNVQILSVYTILAVVFFMFCNSFNMPNQLFNFLAFLIPGMVIVHFVCLLVSVRRRRRRLESAPAEGTKEQQEQS